LFPPVADFEAVNCSVIPRDETTIAYTGDFRLQGKKENATREFVSKARDASIPV